MKRIFSTPLSFTIKMWNDINPSDKCRENLVLLISHYDTEIIADSNNISDTWNEFGVVDVCLIFNNLTASEHLLHLISKNKYFVPSVVMNYLVKFSHHESFIYLSRYILVVSFIKYLGFIRTLPNVYLKRGDNFLLVLSMELKLMMSYYSVIDDFSDFLQCIDKYKRYDLIKYILSIKTIPISLRQNIFDFCIKQKNLELIKKCLFYSVKYEINLELKNSLITLDIINYQKFGIKSKILELLTSEMCNEYLISDNKIISV